MLEKLGMLVRCSLPLMFLQHFQSMPQARQLRIQGLRSEKTLAGSIGAVLLVKELE